MPDFYSTTFLSPGMEGREQLPKESKTGCGRGLPTGEFTEIERTKMFDNCPRKQAKLR